MPYDVFPDYFWLRLFLLIGGGLLVVWLFNIVMHRWLGVRKNRLFSMHYVNDTHRKWDFNLRMSYLGILFLVLLFLLGQEQYPMWFFLLFFPLYFIQVSLQAYMEWKHGKGRTQAIYAIAEFGIFLGSMLLLGVLLFPGILV